MILLDLGLGLGAGLAAGLAVFGQVLVSGKLAKCSSAIARQPEPVEKSMAL
jgi:F0F1-type ATP synthase membrane subunit c/vacuolar-type H+-ATPase subunit K